MFGGRKWRKIDIKTVLIGLCTMVGDRNKQITGIKLKKLFHFDK